MAKRLAEVFVSKVRERQLLTAESVMAIPVEDYGAYRQKSGEYMGLELALSILGEILRGEEDGDI